MAKSKANFMGFFFKTLGRLIVICFALLIAMIAGSLFVGYGLASGVFPEIAASAPEGLLEEENVEFAILAVLAIGISLFASLQLAGLVLLPVTIVIAVCELMRWQSMVAYLLLGGLCALFALFSVGIMPQGNLPSQGTLIVVLATGFVSAFFYWLIAGRSAGNWLGTARTSLDQ